MMLLLSFRDMLCWPVSVLLNVRVPQTYLGCCAEPVVQQERMADKPAEVPANTNVDDKQVKFLH